MFPLISILPQLFQARILKLHDSAVLYFPVTDKEIKGKMGFVARKTEELLKTLPSGPQPSKHVRR
jgi:hypothetical protein